MRYRRLYIKRRQFTFCALLVDACRALWLASLGSNIIDCNDQAVEVSAPELDLLRGAVCVCH